MEGMQPTDRARALCVEYWLERRCLERNGVWDADAERRLRRRIDRAAREAEVTHELLQGQMRTGEALAEVVLKQAQRSPSN